MLVYGAKTDYSLGGVQDRWNIDLCWFMLIYGAKSDYSLGREHSYAVSKSYYAYLLTYLTLLHMGSHMK
jgi:hypothetical protein